MNAWYVHEETRRQTACWDVLQSKFYHDFSFSSKFSKLTLVLQKIKRILFIDEIKPTHLAIVCPKHEYILHYILYPSLARTPMACSKVDRDHEDPNDLEELRHLKFKESEGI
jgi:hypothetical protein